jgi:hypothetical protein
MMPDPSHARPLRWFLLAAPLIVVLGAYANAQNIPSFDAELDLDEFSLEREWDAPYAYVAYHNNASQNSARFPRTLTAGDLTVHLELVIGPGDEVLTVHAPPGWTIVGDPTISVADGDTGYVELIRGGQGM